MAACSSSSPAMEEEITLKVKWTGKEYTVRVCADDTIGELKLRIWEVTNVLPIRQKLLYPKLASKLNDDSLLLSQLSINLYKSSLKFTLIGTTEEDLIVDPVDFPEVLDDFELAQEEAIDTKDMQVNKRKRTLTRHNNHFKVKIQNPCRQGKKLLVLDIDYTILDHRSTAENPLQLMRPYLHEFLTAVYSEYDIMIWSATRMQYITLKMSQLGVLDNPNYKITACLDRSASITFQTASHGVFICKPLSLIWAQFPEFYSASNTIMFDDLRRNFVKNPQNGLTIKPFRKAHENRDSDQELVKLAQYLLAIAEFDDLSHLDHNIWESFSEDTGKIQDE